MDQVILYLINKGIITGELAHLLEEKMAIQSNIRQWRTSMSNDLPDGYTGSLARLDEINRRIKEIISA